MPSHKEHVDKLLRFDKIRIYKLLELFQYSTIFLVVAILLSKAIDYVFMAELMNNKDALAKKSTLQIHAEIVLLSFLYCFISYYVHKFAHIIPSVMSLIDGEFKPHTTLDYSIHIVFIVVFVKMNKSLTTRLEYLNYIH